MSNNVIITQPFKINEGTGKGIQAIVEKYQKLISK